MADVIDRIMKFNQEYFMFDNDDDDDDDDDDDEYSSDVAVHELVDLLLFRVA
jgi:hypothetical protein